MGTQLEVVQATSVRTRGAAGIVISAGALAIMGGAGCYRGVSGGEGGLVATSGTTTGAQGSGSVVSGGEVGDDIPTTSTSSATSATESSDSSSGEGGTAPAETGTGGPEPSFAHDVQVLDVTLNQGVPVRLADAQGVLEPRVTTVAARAGQLQITVAATAEFHSRPVVVEVELLDSGGDFRVLQSTLDLQAPPKGEADPGTVVRFDLEASDLSDGSSYVVRVLEVEPMADQPAARPRVPEEGDASFGFAPRAQRIRITLVPFVQSYDGCPPRPIPIDQAAVDGTAQRLMSRFPASEIEFTWHEPVDFVGTTPDLLADAIAEGTVLRAQDEPAFDVYYTMLASHCDSDPLGGGLGWRNQHPAHPAGATFRVHSVNYSPSFLPQALSPSINHELGHNFGRAHVVCNGEEGGIDPLYPHAGGVIGVEGFDVVTGALLSPELPDLMSYCPEPDAVSDYGWDIAHEVIDETARWLEMEGEATPQHSHHAYLLIARADRPAEYVRIHHPMPLVGGAFALVVAGDGSREFRPAIAATASEGSAMRAVVIAGEPPGGPAHVDVFDVAGNRSVSADLHPANERRPR